MENDKRAVPILGYLMFLLIIGATYIVGNWVWMKWTGPAAEKQVLVESPTAATVQAAPPEPAQVTEPAPPPASPPPAERRLSPQMEAYGEMIATAINLNGLLCAKVVNVRPLQVNNDTFEVTCIEYRGGSSRATYIINTETGVAFEQ